jgi:hypothetical protein
MRREVALTGGAALAAGLVLGFLVDRIARLAPAAGSRTVPPMKGRESRQSPPNGAATVASDVLERYRAAAAV